MAKKKTSIRYSKEADLFVKVLAERLGVSRSAVIELAIRRLAREEGIVFRGQNEHTGQ